MIQTIILILVASTGILALLALLFMIWKFPKWQTKRIKKIEENDEWKAENEFRKTLLQVVGGFVVIIGLYIAFQEIRNFHISQENMKAGQIASRFSQAIEFLEENKTAQNIGGIYALEQIAKESPENYLGTVIEVISAFVRNAEVTFPDFETWKIQHAPPFEGEVGRIYRNKIKPKKEYSMDDFERWLKAQDEKNEELKNLYNDWKNDHYIIKPETQVAMTVLGRIRTEENKFIWEKLPQINLSNVKLRKVQLVKILKTEEARGVNLSGVYLYQADLEDANLKDAYLTEANLI